MLFRARNNTERLIQQRQASPHTITAYRDTLRLLLTFVHQRTRKMPAQLDWDDLDATTISAFLNHLESERRNSTRTLEGTAAEEERARGA